MGKSIKLLLIIIFIIIASIVFILKKFCTTSGTTLVKDGKTDYTIVIGNEADPVSILAAEELQVYIKKISQVTIPIETEKPQNKPAIFIGLSEYIEENEDMIKKLEAIPFGGFVIKTIGDDLLIFGKEPRENLDTIHVMSISEPVDRGTLYGVYHFLYKYLDVRWFWPTEIGEVVPFLNEISLQDIDEVGYPKLQYRYFRLDDPRNKACGLGDEEIMWGLRNLLGIQDDIPFGHAFKNWPDLFFPTHPEYFAKVNGKREINPQNKSHTHLCHHNPEVIQQIVKDAREYFERSPHKYHKSVSPNDGSGGFCECLYCRAEDPPGWLEKYPKKPSSRRIWSFVNKIAKELKKTHPDRYVTCYAYSHYADPPKNLELSDNIITSIVQHRTQHYNNSEREKDLERLEAWQDIGMKCLYIREYYHHFRHTNLRFWGIFPKLMANTIKDLSIFGYYGEDCGGIFPSINPDHRIGTFPIPEIINYYIAARFLWDSDQDVGKFLDDYYTKFYGKAGPYIKQIFEKMEDRWMQDTPEDFKRNECDWRIFYPENFRSDCNILFQEAINAAEDNLKLERVRMLSKAFHFKDDAYESELLYNPGFELNDVMLSPEGNWVILNDLSVKKISNVNYVRNGKYALEIIADKNQHEVPAWAYIRCFGMKPGGKYSCSFWSKAKTVSEPGFYGHILIQGYGGKHVRTEPIKGTFNEWHPFSIELNIPEDCEESCRVFFNIHGRSESSKCGVWFDDFSVKEINSN